MPAKLFDFTPIPQPAAPGRDQALTASPDGSSPLATARLVPLDRLIADPDQPRTVFDEEALGELADSLRAQGMRQPITAYYDDSKERFVVISGERRLIAAARAELARVPVLVERRPGTEGDKLVLQLAENLVREDLTVPEAARALARLRQLRPQDWLEVARRHGIGRRRAYQYLEHLRDAPPLREALEGGAISEGHAEELRRAPEERLTFLLKEVVTHGLSVGNTRKLIAAERAATPPPAERTTAPLGLPATTPPAPSVPPSTARKPLGPMAGAVADTMAADAPPLPPAPLSPGAALREEKQRRERSRRLRARLERIASELRNMHLNEVASELTALPEIILQAREARESLDSFISLLERVQLDKAEAMEQL
ncbi:MAG TPA: ParB/RepB/Spo0J family partition protein [Chloroflexota bacterium]|nr:ParB/RepB/Spo0J family partition protein [Chloroflexota bacterium]